MLISLITWRLGSSTVSQLILWFSYIEPGRPWGICFQIQNQLIDVRHGLAKNQSFYIDVDGRRENQVSW